jgi:membrane-bound lytic murein transglycosylase D
MKLRFDPENRLCSCLLCSVLMLTGMLFSVSAQQAEAAGAEGFARAQYILPPDVQKKGFTFAGARIPFDRREVSVRVLDQVNYLLMDRRAGMMEWFDRMATMGPMMQAVLQEEGVPNDLIYLAALLSDFLPNSRTRSGGVGWWALVSAKDKKSPSAQQWLVTNDWDDRRDPVLSTKIASGILQGVQRKGANNDWLLAMAAFIDGADKIEAIVQKAPGFSYWDMVMPPNSEVIVPRLVALKLIDTHRQYYGVDVSRLTPLHYDSLDRVKLIKDLPLHVVAKWCNLSPRSLWELNPGVDPSTGMLAKAETRSPGGFPLRVPHGMGDKVRQLLRNEGYLAN